VRSGCHGVQVVFKRQKLFKEIICSILFSCSYLTCYDYSCTYLGHIGKGNKLDKQICVHCPLERRQASCRGCPTTFPAKLRPKLQPIFYIAAVRADALQRYARLSNSFQRSMQLGRTYLVLAGARLSQFIIQFHERFKGTANNHNDSIY